MDFLDYLKITAEEIDGELESFFRKWVKEVENVSPRLKYLNDAFIKANEGGKRLRGALIKLGYEMAGGKPTPDILKPAAAYEIFQTGILAHDDIIDQADLRRGKPTLYKELGGDHHGISQTICLGDIGYFLAARLIAENSFPVERKNKAMILFSQAILETALGQMLDVEIPYSKGEKEEVDALTIFRLKTARYTIVGPLQLGAILAGASEQLLEDITNFGDKLGIAFQIQDDILGVFGDEKGLGKSVTSDIEEGKNTLLIIHALKNSNLKQKEILNSFYGRGKIGEQELEQIKQVFVDTGALKYSQDKARELISQAREVIERMEMGDKYRQLLIQMSGFLVQRQK